MARSALALLLLLSTGCYSAFGTDAPTEDDIGDRPGFDLGRVDAGAFDGGGFDGAPPFDASGLDLGRVDLGPPFDAGPVDSGSDVDAAPFDGGPRPDMGRVDAGPRPDLGMSDAAVGLDSGPPPDPTGCRHAMPPPLDAEGLREEDYWFSGSQPNANSTPVIADLEPGDSDPRPAIVWTRANFAETNGRLGIARAGVRNVFPFGASDVDPTANPAAGDLNGDGDLEIVTLLPGSGLVAFGADGREIWRSPQPSADQRAPRGGAVTLADLEGDGTTEVIVGNLIFEGATGMLRAAPTTGDRGMHAGIGPIACVGDVDRDGMQEVVAGGTAYDAQGVIVWDAPGVTDGFCAIGDILPAAGLEVAVVSQGALFVLSGATGAVLDQRPLEGTASGGAGGGPPALADVDSDGSMEIAVAHGNRLGVYDFTCASCAGDLRWSSALVDPSRTAGLSFGDLNADGQWELFALDRFSLYVFAGRDGRLVANRVTASVSVTQAPVLADVDLDGDAELIVPSSRLAAGGIYVERPRPGIQVLGKRDGSWTGARSIWNQHAYHVTNVTDSGRQQQGAITDFRAQSTGADPLDLPNLVGSATVECIGGGRALIRVSVLNAGLAPAGDFEVELTRGIRDLPVTVEPVAGPLNPGERADVAVFTDWMPPMQLYVDRRRDGNVLECNESDNRIDLPRLDCR